MARKTVKRQMAPYTEPVLVEEELSDEEAAEVEAVVEAKAAPVTGNKPKTPLGFVEWVRHPEYGFEAGFRVGAAWGKFNEPLDADQFVDSLLKLSIKVPVFRNWPETFIDPVKRVPIPAPTQDDIETYRPIVWKFGALSDIYGWLLGQGWQTALEQSLGPDFLKGRGQPSAS